jgi:hypothetical protein
VLSKMQCSSRVQLSPMERYCTVNAPGGPSSGLRESFGGVNKKQRSYDGRGGAQRPVGRVLEPKRTGARSARARTRGQNPLVVKEDGTIRLGHPWYPYGIGDDKCTKKITIEFLIETLFILHMIGRALALL